LTGRSRRGFGEFEVRSRLEATPRRVWERITSPAGINAELMPFFRMTMPRGVRALDPAEIQLGTPIGRSWILLFGLIPVDYDDITLVKLEPGKGFLERSTMLSQSLWEHERTLEPNGPDGCVVADRIRFQPRLRLPTAPLRVLFRAVFRHRHRRLRRQFGGSYVSPGADPTGPSAEPRIARTAIGAGTASGKRRTWEAHVAARMPRLANRLFAPVLRLPPGSPVRRRVLARMVGVTFNAMNRRDIDSVARAAYAPDVVLVFHGPAPADIGGDVHRGRDAAFDTYRQWIDAWEDLRRIPLELIDMGDRLLVLVREEGRGREGVVLDEQAASLFTFRAGRVVRQDEYPHWKAALDAVGLPE
jgi:ketosteroid isomerase-like protein/ligand-binding SRPBCC domain-containing protein